MSESSVDIPLVQLVRQTAPQPTVANVADEVRRQWLNSRTAKRIKPGMRIAVGCGSRGIKNYLAIAKATISALKELGANPFVVAAMGSHGGATREGQRELLASYDIDSDHLGVPVVSDMDAVKIGTNSWGQPVWWDKNALAADGVVTVSRVKPHTDFRGSFESGVLKMLVIGLGKRDGADQVHSFGIKGLRDMLPESGKVILEKTPFLGGLAILENANEETAKVEVVDRDDLWDREPQLLDEARRIMGRLPFEAIDVLIVGECGKNYSGAGIDPNVVGRMLLEASPEAETNNPRILSHGRAGGIPGKPRQWNWNWHCRPHDQPRPGVHRPRAVPDEQPDGPISVAEQAADRLRDRSRGDWNMRRDLLAAGVIEDQVLCDSEHP